ncbi:hypothetical protein KY284_000625 [Solanum tuberosum]|nr:hypothetical protein KY284_000625 [Solanum tuberosum]
MSNQAALCLERIHTRPPAFPKIREVFQKNGAFFQASYPSRNKSSMLLSRGKNGKRICVTTAFENFEQRNHFSIEIFINKFLLEVFKRLPSGRKTSVCACVSKRWLTLLSSVHKDAITESNGYLDRSLVGRKVTIVKLVAIAVGTSNHGGLTKLSIRGNNLCRGVTYIGLKDISRGSPTLREHSLWNVSSVGDEGLDGSTSLEHRSSDAVNECRMMNSSTTNPCDPNLVPSWKRSFDILGALEFVPGMLNSCIQVHPPSRVRHKVSERYVALVDFMCSKDLVMRTLINDVELLILASTTLCSDSQSAIGAFVGVTCNLEIVSSKG